jgi:ribosomal protein S13
MQKQKIKKLKHKKKYRKNKNTFFVYGVSLKILRGIKKQIGLNTRKAYKNKKKKKLQVQIALKKVCPITGVNLKGNVTDRISFLKKIYTYRGIRHK